MRRTITALLIASALTSAALAQDFGFRGFGFRGRFRIYPNAAYDGRFTFVRIRYNHLPGGNWYGGWPAWSHGYPIAEQNLMRIMNEVSYLGPHIDEINELTFDDPDLLRYPVAYLSEPGYWYPTESEVLGLRTYLAKGGFLIVDDFMQNEWYNFERQMLRVLPGANIEQLRPDHPVFNSFFHIQSFDLHHPQNDWLRAVFLGIHEDNDPNKRLMVVIDYNTDIGDFMEWSDENFWPVNVTNDAYKFAINYIVYGMTH